MSEAAVLALIALIGSLGTLYIQSRYGAKFTQLEADQKVCKEQDKVKGERIAVLEGHIMTLLLTVPAVNIEAARKVESAAKDMIEKK